MYVGGNRGPRRKPTLSERVALSITWGMGLTGNRTHDLRGATGADVKFEHRSYHCATLTADSGRMVPTQLFRFKSAPLSNERKRRRCHIDLPAEMFGHAAVISCWVVIHRMAYKLYNHTDVPRCRCLSIESKRSFSLTSMHLQDHYWEDVGNNT
jgi:hypothetical protein